MSTEWNTEYLFEPDAKAPPPKYQPTFNPKYPWLAKAPLGVDWGTTGKNCCTNRFIDPLDIQKVPQATKTNLRSFLDLHVGKLLVKNHDGNLFLLVDEAESLGLDIFLERNFYSWLRYRRDPVILYSRKKGVTLWQYNSNTTNSYRKGAGLQGKKKKEQEHGYEDLELSDETRESIREAIKAKAKADAEQLRKWGLESHDQLDSVIVLWRAISGITKFSAAKTSEESRDRRVHDVSDSDYRDYSEFLVAGRTLGWGYGKHEEAKDPLSLKTKSFMASAPARLKVFGQLSADFQELANDGRGNYDNVLILPLIATAEYALKKGWGIQEYGRLLGGFGEGHPCQQRSMHFRDHICTKMRSDNQEAGGDRAISKLDGEKYRSLMNPCSKLLQKFERWVFAEVKRSLKRLPLD